MTKEELIEFLNKTPENFNPNVVRDLIESGGGNPNYVETITGTAANPWGELTYNDISLIQRQIINKIVTLILSITTPAGVLKMYLDASGAYDFHASGAFYTTGDEPSLNEAYGIKYISNNGSYTLDYLLVTISGVTTDYTQYASTFPTTLTIIYHPLSRGS